MKAIDVIENEREDYKDYDKGQGCSHVFWLMVGSQWSVVSGQLTTNN
jgi:hypothetical protein